MNSANLHIGKFIRYKTDYFGGSYQSIHDRSLARGEEEGNIRMKLTDGILFSHGAKYEF